MISLHIEPVILLGVLIVILLFPAMVIIKKVRE